MKSKFGHKKAWILYGALFASIGFSLSGNDPNKEGHSFFSSESPAPKTPVLFQLRPTQSKQPTTETPQSTETIATPPPELSQNSDLNSGVFPDSEYAVMEKPSKVQYAPTPRISESRFIDFPVVVNSQTLQVRAVSKDGKVYASYAESMEGRTCDGHCERKAGEVVVTGDIKNIMDIQLKISNEISKNIQNKDKNIKIDSDDTEDDSEDISVGYKVLARKIDKACRTKEGTSDVQCRVEKFIQTLKDDKKLALDRHDSKYRKRGYSKSPITDDDASAYFDEYLKDGLKEMLTHSFTVHTYDDAFGLVSAAAEDREEKRQALEEKNLAKQLIRSLLRDINRTFKDTRKSVSELYKVALDSQVSEVKQSLTQMALSKDTGDMFGFKSGQVSFANNLAFLKLLDGDLYSTMSDGLNFSKSQYTSDSSFYGDILRSLMTERSDFQRMITNPNFADTGLEKIYSMPDDIIRTRQNMNRGNVGLTSGSTSTPSSNLAPIPSGTRNIRGN